MTKNNYIGKFNALSIALVYFVFSCCYVTHCPKATIPAWLTLCAHAGHQQATLNVANDRDSATGKFLTRPRVISGSNKSIVIAASVVILNFTAVDPSVKQSVSFSAFDHSRSLSALQTDIVAAFGNWRI